MGAQGGPSIVKNELIFLVDAANPQSYKGSGTEWTDISGFYSSSSMTNSPTWNSGGYFEFDGTDTFLISTLNGYTDLTNVSIFSVFRTGAVSGYDSMCGFGEGLDESDSNSIGIWSSGNTFGLCTWNNDLYGVSGVVTPSSNDFYIGMFQLEYGSGFKTGFKMWINDDEQTPSQVRGTTLQKNRSTVFNIGSCVVGLGDYWLGDIAYIAIYNGTMTTEKAMQNYNQLKDRFQ